MGEVVRKNITWYSVKNGSLNKWNGKSKETTRVDGYTGFVVGVKIKPNEFEGKQQPRIQLTLKDTDSDALAVLEWSQESYMSVNFFSAVKQLNLTKPLTVTAYASKQNEKITFLSLYQDGKRVEFDKDFPKPESVKVGNNSVGDYTKLNAVVEKMVVELQEALKAVAPVDETKEKDEEGW